MAHEITTIHGGLAGTTQTVRRIERIVREGARHPEFIRLARSILAGAGVPERNAELEIIAVHNWVKNNSRYTNDSTEAEVLSSPGEMLRMYQEHGVFIGDCDELVALEAMLLRAIGRRTRFVVISNAQRDPSNRMTHIYHEVLMGGEWVPLDPILKRRPAGYAVPGPTAKKIYDLGETTMPRFQRVSGSKRGTPTSERRVPPRVAAKQAERAAAMHQRALLARGRDARHAQHRAEAVGRRGSIRVDYTQHGQHVYALGGPQRRSPGLNGLGFDLSTLDVGGLLSKGVEAYQKKADKRAEARRERRAARAPDVVAAAARGEPTDPATLARALSILGLQSGVAAGPQAPMSQAAGGLGDLFRSPVVLLGGGALLLFVLMRRR